MDYTRIFVTALVGGFASVLVGFVVYLVKQLKTSFIQFGEIKEKMTFIEREQIKLLMDTKLHKDSIEQLFVATLINLLMNCKQVKSIDMSTRSLIEGLYSRCKMLNINGSTTAIFKELETLIDETLNKERKIRSKKDKK